MALLALKFKMRGLCISPSTSNSMLLASFAVKTGLCL